MSEDYGSTNPAHCHRFSSQGQSSRSKSNFTEMLSILGCNITHIPTKLHINFWYAFFSFFCVDRETDSRTMLKLYLLPQQWRSHARSKHLCTANANGERQNRHNIWKNGINDRHLFVRNCVDSYGHGVTKFVCMCRTYICENNFNKKFALTSNLILRFHMTRIVCHNILSSVDQRSE